MHTNFQGFSLVRFTFSSKSLPKGTFVVMKTGFYPMKVKLKLFFEWGIKFEEAYTVEENGNRQVAYANSTELMNKIIESYNPDFLDKIETEAINGKKVETYLGNVINIAARIEALSKEAGLDDGFRLYFKDPSILAPNIHFPTFLIVMIN